ncbi:hypothetical protein [Dactylosporangium sp. NPDC050588]|uniref:hypothetical protein n=1 Tax=Dactylosporangium sp. NPDC050588 TaxID=3157211 RepID=UPI0033E30CBA
MGDGLGSAAFDDVAVFVPVTIEGWRPTAAAASAAAVGLLVGAFRDGVPDAEGTQEARIALVL